MLHQWNKYCYHIDLISGAHIITLAPTVGSTLNSAFNEVAFNENSAITKENLRTKYTYSSINASPLTKSRL